MEDYSRRVTGMNQSENNPGRGHPGSQRGSTGFLPLTGVGGQGRGIG